MDIFKGIGDFFGGLFGQKKKREDEQQQPQQQQSAVSFNSTPKLGDNFANNASNPTQPQQPKEFAKSSVDLNPVKPVQPVQPQPQVNRDQERQQLANKYRQEETDRYNQGSDHAANFLNDIFSGGKTAQMRENTINQNIQNRVNAEMLRKYGPDDQQVKQNIAQTSQDINNNATSVNDFTKNYNNTVQQTVASPVSAVKGAANSVVETMPKVSGAVTELGANTIKLFDEDNQFANNLINRVRADREKNIVRKTLNSATGLTDQDNKMAYGLGSSGTRMAIDAAMTPVTGGAVPALVHGVEAHSEMMDNLDNIEARKKAEAAAKGEAYTPSSFTSRYLAATANAGAQAAIEKLGIDNVTGKIGGKFAKNMAGRAITGALGEAGEEAAQQYAENFTKKLFDNKQNIHEGVAESALMGGIMGGAGKMAFGGMESVKNPYKSNDMADGEVSISKLHPDQMGYNPKNLIEAERNATIPAREKITLTEAERQNRGGDLQYTPRRETNINRLDGDQLGFTKDELVGRFTGDTRKRMSERSFNMLQDLRTNNPYVTGDGQEIHLSGRGNKKFVNTQAGTDAEFIAKMRSTPRINELIQNSEYSHTSPDTKNHGIAPDGFDYRDVNFKYGGKDFNTTFNVARNNTINRNTLYGATTKENISTPGLRDNPSTKSYADVYTNSIAQNGENVNAVNPENRYLLNSIPETDQKTRKFAETVLDTDTPPKDFVKLMHAGDESLKYTPKKNSELWNRATKSVQESPERVFNELENTRVANDETMAKGIALAKHYQAMGDDLKASELYVELAKKATEAGRTVQALNLMRRTTPEGVLMSTMREVESYNDKMKNKPNKQINITPEQRAEFLGKLREAYAMPEGNLKEIRARRIAIGEAIREVRDQIPSSKWDKFTTLWKAGLLTAPTTHIRNIAGNIINGGSEKFAQTVGSAFDWMISKGTGRRTLTRNGFSGMFKGIKEGSGYAKDIMRTGIDTTGEIDSKWRDQRTNYGNSLGGKLAQGYTDFVFNSLNASDKIFRGSAEKMSIANQAKAIAINERLKGDERKARIRQLINNPTNAMLENAKHDADMATFQQDTGLGQFVAKGRQAGGITKKATDIIMPFTGVPSAVADQLVNYSPLGVAKGVKQVADLRKAVKNGLDESTITALQRKASTQLGRGITGTMLLGAGLALANAGLLSGQPRDDDEKRQWAAEGKKANALKIGNTWIPIDTLSPQMILAAAGANAESRIKNGQGALEAGLNTLGDGVKSWTEQGYMTGVKDAIDTATGDKDLNKYAIQQATSLIPNGIRKAAAAMDDKARQANYGDLGESIQNSIPLWRNGLPAKHDIYGREIKTNPWSTMLDPQKSSTENPTGLSQKINEFRKNNPELDSVIPKTAPNKITINGQTRELTSSERSEYQRLLGENISKYMMSGGFNDSSFNKLSEGDKKDMLKKIQSDVKQSVEMALFNKTSKQTNDNAKKIAQNIVNGGNNELSPEWKTKEQSKDELYEKPELEYERLKAEYDKKKKNGDFDGRKVQELQERMKVRKAQVGKDTPKSYRDMYSSGKQSFNMLLKEMDSDQERNEAMTKVLEYGDKLVAAGLEKKNKFRDKYGNVNFDDSSSGKGGKKGKSAKVSASSVGTADITSTLSKNLLKTRGSQAKALSGMPTISVRNSGLQAKAKRSAVRFKK